jgi:hypothetical protein
MIEYRKWYEYEGETLNDVNQRIEKAINELEYFGLEYEIVFHLYFWQSQYVGFLYFHHSINKTREVKSIIEQHDLPNNPEEWTEDQKMLFRLSLT